MRKLRKAWENYLKKLAKANRESFGGGRVDCCDLKDAAGRRRQT